MSTSTYLEMDEIKFTDSFNFIRMLRMKKHVCSDESVSRCDERVEEWINNISGHNSVVHHV